MFKFKFLLSFVFAIIVTVQFVDSMDVGSTGSTTADAKQNSTTECNPIDFSNLKSKFQTKVNEYEDQKTMCAYVIERLQDERARSTIDIERDSNSPVHQTDRKNGDKSVLASIFRQFDNVSPGLNVDTAVLNYLIGALDKYTLGFNSLRYDYAQVMNLMKDEGKCLEAHLDLKSILHSAHEEMRQMINKLHNDSNIKGEMMGSIMNTLVENFNEIHDELTNLETGVNTKSLQGKIKEIKGEIVGLNRTLFANLSTCRMSKGHDLSVELNHFKGIQGNLSRKFKEKIIQTINNTFINDSNQKNDDLQTAIQSINESYQEYLRAKVVTISENLNFLFSDRIKNYDCVTAYEKLSNATQTMYNKNVQFIESLVKKQESRIKEVQDSMAENISREISNRVSKLEYNIGQISQQNTDALAVLTKAVFGIERITTEILQRNNDSLNALTIKIAKLESYTNLKLENNAEGLQNLKGMVENQLNTSKSNLQTLEIVSNNIKGMTGK